MLTDGNLCAIYPRRLGFAFDGLTADGRTVKCRCSKPEQFLRAMSPEVVARCCAAHPELLGDGTDTVKAATTPVASDFLFRLVDFSADFLQRMRDAASWAIPVCAQGALEELGFTGKFLTPAGLVEDFVIRRENRLKKVPDDIYEEIRGRIEDGIQKGMSFKQVAKTVEDSFDQTYKGRAFTVARTEAGSAYGRMQQESLEQTGTEYKQWFTAHDDRVRDSHNDFEAMGPIPVDEDFADGLSYPSDPDCDDPGEVINCRCVLLPAKAPEEVEG
jgi:SPP1 gp7 family putative phage head morphogenesis protein